MKRLFTSSYENSGLLNETNVATSTHKGSVVLQILDEEAICDLSPDEAVDIANCLLMAAKAAREERK